MMERRRIFGIDVVHVYCTDENEVCSSGLCGKGVTRIISKDEVYRKSSDEVAMCTAATGWSWFHWDDE
jgi:hypothetical protein